MRRLSGDTQSAREYSRAKEVDVLKGFWEFVLALTLYTFGGGVVGAVLGTWWILYLFISNNPGKTSTMLGALPVITAIVGGILGTLGFLVFATVKMAKRK